MIWHAAGGWTLAWAILLVLQGLLPAATVWLMRLVVDAIVQAIAAGISLASAAPVLTPAALLAAAMLAGEVLQSAGDWVRTNQSELIQDHISELIHRKSAEVDLAHYESPDYLDSLYRASSELASRPLSLLENLGGLLQNGVTLAAMGAVLVPYGLWLPAALLLSMLPALYVVIRHNRRYHRWWERSTQDRRWGQYYSFLLTSSGPAAEVRLFDLGPRFQRAYRSLRAQLRRQRLALMRGQTLGRAGAGVLALLVSAAATAWMGLRVLTGLGTLGDLTLFYQAFSRGQSLMRALLGNLGQVYSNTLFLGNLFQFLSLQPRVKDAAETVPVPWELRRGIEIRNVSFTYPGCERPVLEDFSLAIPAGRIVAIVGANGAGKSTLLKLLCRFYDVDSGAIELDGTDIRDVQIAALRRQITVLFQWPVPYHATAAENIALGDPERGLTNGDIEAAARAAGAHDMIVRLPKGYDSLLGRYFADGSELSAGEWQRLALARAFFREAQFIILDEPTSFMDSWAEADWFERFRSLAHGRTALIITHRFTIAKRADVIHVMDGGRLIESGTHDELLARGGLYAQSWKAQMQAGPASAVEVTV